MNRYFFVFILFLAGIFFFTPCPYVSAEDTSAENTLAIDEIRGKLAEKDDYILRVQLLDRLVWARRLDEAREEITHLKKMRLPAELIGFFESAIDIAEENWEQAAKKLEQAGDLFRGHPATQAYVDKQLALCYGKLLQIDKQLDAFQRAIKNTPDEEVIPISIAYIFALSAMGKTERLKEAFSDLEAKTGEPAEIYFSEMVKLSPQYSTGWLALLQALKIRDVQRETLEIIVAKMRESLQVEILPMAEGNAMMILGDINAAEAAFQKALEQRPEKLMVLSSISHLYLNSENPWRAAPYLEKMAEIIEADQDTDAHVRKARLEWVRETQAKIAESGK